MGQPFPWTCHPLWHHRRTLPWFSEGYLANHCPQMPPSILELISESLDCVTA